MPEYGDRESDSDADILSAQTPELHFPTSHVAGRATPQPTHSSRSRRTLYTVRVWTTFHLPFLSRVRYALAPVACSHKEPHVAERRAAALYANWRRLFLRRRATCATLDLLHPVPSHPLLHCMQTRNPCHSPPITTCLRRPTWQSFLCIHGVPISAPSADPRAINEPQCAALRQGIRASAAVEILLT
jgi:hypothetical protein